MALNTEHRHGRGLVQREVMGVHEMPNECLGHVVRDVVGIVLKSVSAGPSSE